MNDNEIVDLFLVRDEGAIGETAVKYGPRLRSLAHGIVQNFETAEECENDTYMQAWKSIPPHEPRSYLYPFLARITRHLALNCCRERASLKRSAYICQLSQEMEQCIPGPDELQCRMDDMTLKELINEFLEELDGEKRNIFIRRYWFLDSTADISKRFAISESKVKTTLFRCRNKLRQHLQKEGYCL